MIAAYPFQPPVYGAVQGGYSYNADPTTNASGSSQIGSFVPVFKPLVLITTSTTLAFADSAYLDNTGLLWESIALRGPGSLYGEYQVSNQPAGFWGYDFTHFRHDNMANVSFMDGHVETVSVSTANVADPSFCPAVFTQARQQYNLGFVSSSNSVYVGN